MTCEKVAKNGPNLKKLAQKISNWRMWWRKKKNPSADLIAPSRGRQLTGNKNVVTTERLFLFAHMLQVSKCYLRNLIYTYFLMLLYMLLVYSPVAKAENPLGTNF